MRCVCIKKMSILQMKLKDVFDYNISLSYYNSISFDDEIYVYLVNIQRDNTKYPITKKVFDEHFLEENLHQQLIREGKLNELL